MWLTANPKGMAEVQASLTLAAGGKPGGAGSLSSLAAAADEYGEGTFHVRCTCSDLVEDSDLVEE